LGKEKVAKSDLALDYTRVDYSVIMLATKLAVYLEERLDLNLALMMAVTKVLRRVVQLE